ncbi:MAG: polysaccharide deacetylase family protein [Bacteroidetes bacterium]|nr:MAG: polysaccharide deacetylase family protein [Bacteroidota bacterium]
MPRWFSSFFPTLLWQKKTDEKIIYLTFDDGPIPEITEWILDILSEYNAKATFFCVGDNVKKHQNIFQRVINEGHQVGNHTFNHLNGWEKSTEEYMKNVDLCQNAMQKNATHFFRPPYGKLSRKKIKALEQKKFQIVMWHVLTYDFDKNLSPEICLKKAIQNTKKGSIVVFHDNKKAIQNLQFVLPKYIQYFKEKGYAFCHL